MSSPPPKLLTPPSLLSHATAQCVHVYCAVAWSLNFPPYSALSNDTMQLHCLHIEGWDKMGQGRDEGEMVRAAHVQRPASQLLIVMSSSSSGSERVGSEWARWCRHRVDGVVVVNVVALPSSGTSERVGEGMSSISCHPSHGMRARANGALNLHADTNADAIVRPCSCLHTRARVTGGRG